MNWNELKWFEMNWNELKWIEMNWNEFEGYCPVDFCLNQLWIMNYAGRWRKMFHFNEFHGTQRQQPEMAGMKRNEIWLI